MSFKDRKAPPEAKPLLDIVDVFPVEGFERSFRMSKGLVFWNRFLFGIKKKDIPPDRLLEVCMRIGMPQEFQSMMQESLLDANQVLFGFEQGDTGSSFKVYLEYWEKVKRQIRTRPDRVDPVPLHLGFKWDCAAPERNRITDYTCYPLLKPEAIQKRLGQVYFGHEELASLHIIRDIISLARQRAPNPSFLYLEVSEKGNPRCSFDINLYNAGLRLKELSSHLYKLRTHYEIAEENFSEGFADARGKLFGHLAGGVDRDGQDFCTVYYEDFDETTVRSAPAAVRSQPVQVTSKTNRNDPCPCGSGRKYKKCCGRE
jgi:hypothetical protein